MILSTGRRSRQGAIGKHHPRSVAGGFASHLLCSFESEGVYGVEVIGTEAKLVIPNPWLPPGGVGELQVTRNGKTETVRLSASHPLSHFAAEIEHFAECVRENRAPTMVTEADSRETMRVIEALRASAAQYEVNGGRGQQREKH
ncbi:MAG: hypothetical protein FJ395_14430 [Verrucomicrobia bacterium]|nr:hypothetical protein [Verrucomicrobiota bacterium]